LLLGRTLFIHNKLWANQIRPQFFEAPAFFGFIVACLEASAVKETLRNDAPPILGERRELIQKDFLRVPPISAVPISVSALVQ
jgi:hypothetical protein